MAGGLTVVEARSLASRLRGLGGLDCLPAQLALEIRTSSVHTFTVRFALDLVWLAGDGRVLAVDREVPPRRVAIRLRARSVIETAAGQGDRFAAALEPG